MRQMSRQRLGLPEHERTDAVAERAAALTALTVDQLQTFLRLCISRHDSKRIDPGALRLDAADTTDHSARRTMISCPFSSAAARSSRKGHPQAAVT